MSAGEGKRHGWRYAAAAAGVTVGMLAVPACGADGAPQPAKTHASPSPGSQTEPESGFKGAYVAGYTEGRRVYDKDGKGTAVREVVHGGCARRALDADTHADGDRGSWVKGCRDGVLGDPENPPAHPLSDKQTNPALLRNFRAWARAEGHGALARHADELFTVTLVGPDYDVEIKTDYTSRSQAKHLAGTFEVWWDGDDGHGIARSVVILDAHNRHIAIQSL
ncbi:hypothetical protein AB0C93_37665 [Streptomyces sp. NPDC048518]|uniref:hypothetical protein n=1 Tax=Streptomyces sp. NPDC048518 TaxID=3155029 RepID=UPI0033D6F4D2